jgi:hypothetical protein
LASLLPGLPLDQSQREFAHVFRPAVPSGHRRLLRRPWHPVFGIGTFAKGGEFNKRNANKIMRWRIGVQFVAVILIVAFAWLTAGGN